MSTSSNPDSPRRVSIPNLAREAYLAHVAFEGAIQLEPGLRELVKIRASQINGCAFCIDMHTLAARRRGESDRRMHALAAWKESPLFNARERAALTLTEALTRIAEGGLHDEVYEQAAAAFEPAELANLVLLIAAINSWNRIAIAGGAVFEAPGD